ncbi:MAG TPA: N-acetylmuramoyl-L-alanine amidase-like domain-containing protein [Thermodesulfobacteriota bacterium]|nr:N-acetylmuramoyl-L-alanine amidase-like domain-containing protein [Thermodesulfobacteriota bacterium]
MKRIRSLSLVLMLLGMVSSHYKAAPAHAEERGVIVLGRWTEDELDKTIRESSKIKDTGERINFVSSRFLDTEYRESTLIGDANTPEVLVINLEGMDCFTYIDYVEAIRLSRSFTEFKENLKRVRYRSAKVTFQNRNHFFTDWREFNREKVVDVTEWVGGEKTRTVHRVLNRRKDGTLFLPGIPPKKREINYIPSNALDENVIGRLKTGDYAGIYSDTDGLDVSHTGIVIKKGNGVYLRHASSREENRRVVDEDLRDYMRDKPGLIVLRPR